METTARRMKVCDVSIDWSSKYACAVIVKFEETENNPELFYMHIGAEDAFECLRRKLKVSSLMDLKGKNVIAIMRCNCVVAIAYDDSSLSEDGTFSVKQVAITELKSDVETITITTEWRDEKFQYDFPKGSYALKAFMSDVGVMFIKELIGESVIAYMEDEKVVQLTSTIYGINLC